MKFVIDGSALLCRHQGETLCIEPWGKDSLRVRAAMQSKFSGNDWALTEPVESAQAEITVGERQAAITNGQIKAVVNHAGIISFYTARSPARAAA